MDFYYDIVCPYAYLASTQVEELAEKYGEPLRYRPVLLGGLLRTVGSPTQPMTVMGDSKRVLIQKDIVRQANEFRVPLRRPEDHPKKTVDAMRLLVAADEATRREMTQVLYKAYWWEGRDINDGDFLGSLAGNFGLDPEVYRGESVRQQLFDNTEEAAQRGAFGVPSFWVKDQLLWGSDRMHFVESLLGGPSHKGIEPTKHTGHVRFFHDFSSPFSYLAATQIDRVAKHHQATLEWSPFLLGGLFRAIGTPVVPLATMTQARQTYQQRDMMMWAKHWDVPFQFPSRFPLRTVTALRVAIIEPRATLPIYRAAWAEDKDISEPAVLSQVLDEAGFNGTQLVAGTQDPEVKDILRKNTEEAVGAGACGAPSFLVDHSHLIWGQDRLHLVEALLAGSKIE